MVLRYSKILVGACAILVMALELCSIYVVRHYSVTFTRVSRQFSEAVKMRPAPPGEPTSVLMVGNSLLLYGVDVDRLHTLTSNSLQIYPIFMEGTGYFDWLYGLRHLFRQGARPQVVVAGLEANSSLANGVSEESPMLLFDSRDVLGVASDLKLDRTETTSLWLSHVSAFWGLRTFFRRRIFRHLIPHYESLFPFMRPDLVASHGADDATLMARLRTLRDLCEAHGAKLIVVIPPTPSSESAVREMATAAQKVGVETLVPIGPNVLSAKFYQSDLIHLNSEGAVRFTLVLAADLPKSVMAVTDHAS